MTIKSLYLPKLESNISAIDIIEDFYVNDIATISKVALKPYNIDQKLYYKAYIDIHVWHDTEYAYEFIQLLQDQVINLYYTFQNNDRCLVKINTENWMTFDSWKEWTNCHITTNYLVTDTPVSSSDKLDLAKVLQDNYDMLHNYDNLHTYYDNTPLIHIV